MHNMQIIAETDEWLIIDKPALLDSQNSRRDRPSVVAWLKQKFGFSGLVHRLDFGTSGLMVCAKNKNSAKKLTNDLQSEKIKRTYQAIVLGKKLPLEGIIKTDLDGKTASTHYKVIDTFANATWVEVTLGTGRKHQIRRHFAEAGHPVLGDHLYGKKGAARLFSRPALHAGSITVYGHTYSVPLPKDMNALVKRLSAVSRGDVDGFA